jgi:hypothetical protein
MFAARFPSLAAKKSRFSLAFGALAFREELRDRVIYKSFFNDKPGFYKLI